MKEFNADVELSKIENKKKRKPMYTVLVAVVGVLIIFGFSYAFYEVNVTEEVVNGKVGDFTVSAPKFKIFVDTNEVESIPENDGSVTFNTISCEDGNTMTWDNDTWTSTVVEGSQDYCTIYFNSVN